jgi:hypothetical protein
MAKYNLLEEKNHPVLSHIPWEDALRGPDKDLEDEIVFEDWITNRFRISGSFRSYCPWKSRPWRGNRDRRYASGLAGSRGG